MGSLPSELELLSTTSLFLDRHNNLFYKLKQDHIEKNTKRHVAFGEITHINASKNNKKTHKKTTKNWNKTLKDT